MHMLPHSPLVVGRAFFTPLSTAPSMQALFFSQVCAHALGVLVAHWSWQVAQRRRRTDRNENYHFRNHAAIATGVACDMTSIPMWNRQHTCHVATLPLHCTQCAILSLRQSHAHVAAMCLLVAWVDGCCNVVGGALECNSSGAYIMTNGCA